MNSDENKFQNDTFIRLDATLTECNSECNSFFLNATLNATLSLNATTECNSECNSFNFKEGACGSFIDQSGIEFALLCFDREDPTTCYTCYDLENGICHKLESMPTRKATRNAIRIGKYQGRIQMPI